MWDAAAVQGSALARAIHTRKTLRYCGVRGPRVSIQARCSELPLKLHLVVSFLLHQY